MTNKFEIGQRFGMLRITGARVRTTSMTYWVCVCDCGKLRRASAAALKDDLIFSCGCTKRNSQHGHTANGEMSLTYSSWKSMVARCNQVSNPAFNYYRARGITICNRWTKGRGAKTGFECFLEDMGERPSEAHTIDRWPNNDGGYKPSNCRWATKQEQANNRITNRRYPWKGKMWLLSELTEKTGLSKECLRSRITRAGLTVEQAIAMKKYSRIHRV